jgi:hypothetical protein
VFILVVRHEKKKGIYNSHERMLTVTVIDRGKPCAPC